MSSGRLYIASRREVQTDASNIRSISNDGLRALCEALVRLREYQTDMHTCRKMVVQTEPGTQKTFDGMMDHNIEDCTDRIRDDIISAMENLLCASDLTMEMARKIAEFLPPEPPSVPSTGSEAAS